MIAARVPENHWAFQLPPFREVDQRRDCLGAVDGVYEYPLGGGEQVDGFHHARCGQTVAVSQIVLREVDVLKCQAHICADEAGTTLGISEVLAAYVIIDITGDDDTADSAWRTVQGIAQH
ncbi:hypothetical protein D3C79_885520 [compost metagenome]